MKLILLTCLLVASLAQEKGSSRQHKAWKFTEDSKKENSSSPKESVREERTSDLLRPSEDESSREPKILDARTSTNNRSSEEIEGRFFLKDKLCLLGLADCRQKNAYYSGGAGVNLGGIQYVQPIKVVPHGQPIAAVPIANPHNSGPTHSNYQVSSHQAHHKPTYGAPKPTYDAPQPIYGAPKPTYNSPKPTYDAPKPTYGAPEPTYDAPNPTYGAPKPTYNSPKPTYGAPKPTYGAPKPIYKAPKPTYGAPSSYGAPSYNAPSSSYGSQDSYGINNRYEGQLTGNIYSHPYQTNFESTAVKRDDGVTHGHHGSQHHGGSSHGHHNSNAHHQSGAHHGLQTSHNSAHQNGIHSSESHSTHGHKGDHRQGRLEDDCYCVPLNQCPSHEIVTSGSSSRFTNGDASTHFTNGGGSSQFTNGGASNQFINGATSSQFTNGGFSSQFTNGGASSQFTNGGASSQFTNGGTSSQFTNGGASSQFSSGAAKQFPNSQKKDYSHLINPRNKKTDIEAEEDEGAVEKKEIVESKKKVENEEALSPRNARSGKSLEVEKPVMNITKEETISKNDNKESESRKKRDIEEPQDLITGEEDVLPRLTNSFVDEEVTTISEEEEEIATIMTPLIESLSRDNEIIIEEGLKSNETEERNKIESKISLEEVQNRVNDTLSNAVDTASSVKDKVSTKVNDILKNIGTALGFGENFQPTVGVSFGLPYNPNNVYAGQQINPLGTGSAVNPYYTGPNGLPVGALDVSPLVSFQATTNDQGEIVSKPLINLHLTPNGCGIFGCDSAEDYTKKSSTYNQYLANSYYPPGAPVSNRKFGPERNPNVIAPSPSKKTVSHEHHHYIHGGENYNSLPYNDNFASRIGLGPISRVPVSELQSKSSIDKKGGFRFPEGRSLDRKKRELPSSNPFLKMKDPINNDHQQLNSESNIVQGRQRIPFGPNGVKPPTCGFPNSGYVCCRVAPSQGGLTQFVGSSVNTGSSSNFNQLSNQKNNRAVSSQSSGFTSFSNNINSGFPSPGQCGKRNAQGINGRITGTQFERKSGETEFGEYPWQVAILKKDEFDNVYLCAGSLIDGSHVITAAHCIRGYNPDEIVLRLGEWDVNNDSEFYTHIELDAKNLFIHEEFYPGNLYNDIAVIRMTEYVDFSRNRHISPVCLPDSFHNFAGQRCFVTGWGKDAFLDGNYQHILKEVNLPVVDNSRCENLLRRTKLGRDFTLDKGFLCAGGEEGKDACKGDGGGPLVCSVNGLWQLAGIVSWGIGCGEQNIPGVYIKVSEYENWIQKQLLRTL